MEIFVGRQPILDGQRRTRAYELLFRSSQENRANPCGAQESATEQVIANSFFSLGIDSIAAGLPVFVNFPRKLLLDTTAVLLPTETTVIEVLEDVEADAELIAACQALKHRGFRIAVDDFRGETDRDSLIALADYLKVDFRLTDQATRSDIRARFARRGLEFLAEKVETQEEFHEAMDLGYSLFQGYFFAKPQVMKASEVPTLKANAIRLLQEIHRPEQNQFAIAQLVRTDVSLCRRLLRYMNSAAFAWHSPVVSVERALNNLGENGTRRWLSMAVLPQLTAGSAGALVLTSLTRAKFLEQAAARLGAGEQSETYFLMGLFSLLDAMLDRPLAEALEDVPLHAHAKAALLGQLTSGNSWRLWNLTLACEAAEAGRAAELGEGTPLRPELTAQMWTTALAWSNTIVHDILPPS